MRDEDDWDVGPCVIRWDGPQPPPPMDPVALLLELFEAAERAQAAARARATEARPCADT